MHDRNRVPFAGGWRLPHMTKEQKLKLIADRQAQREAILAARTPEENAAAAQASKFQNMKIVSIELADPQ